MPSPRMSFLLVSLSISLFSSHGMAAGLDKAEENAAFQQTLKNHGKADYCGIAVTGRIDWPSFEAHQDKLGNASIAGNCDVASELAGFCAEHGNEPLKRYTKIVCAYQPEGDAEFTRRGFEVQYQGDTLVFRTNLQRGTLNLGEVIHDTVPKVGSTVRGTFQAVALMKHFDKTFAEAMSVLKRDDHCGRELAASIDWASFKTPFHTAEDGTKLDIAGYCSIGSELGSYCDDHGKDVFNQVKKYRCVYRADGDAQYREKYWGVEMKLDGDTLTMFTNMRGSNLNERVPAMLDKVMPAKGGQGGNVGEQAERDRYDNLLKEAALQFGRKGNCGLPIDARIDWKSFGTPFFQFEDGMKPSISGYCNIFGALDSYCADHGKQSLARIKKYRCVYRPKGDAQYMQQYWGVEMKIEGDTLTMFTNMRGANLDERVPQMLDARLGGRKGKKPMRKHR